MKFLLIALLLLPCGNSMANRGMEIGVSMPYSGTAVPGRPIGMLSGFMGSLSSLPGYSEYGFIAMLPLGQVKMDSSGRSRITELVGMYGGQLLLPFQGLLRPGFNLGWLWETQSRLSRDGTDESDRHLSLYYAFKLQFSCLTFLASNIGVGGGINFSL